MPPKKKAASAEEKPKTASKRKAEDDGSTQEPKKQRAPRSITGVSAEDFNATKPAPLKKQYNQMVKKFHKMVDADWHDGYEEQGEYVIEYFGTWQTPAQAIYNILAKDLAFDRCHEALMILADSWENMKSVPMRGTTEENLQDSDTPISLKGDTTNTYTMPEEVLNALWKMLIQRAASQDSITEEQLQRFIKDATDYGCKPEVDATGRLRTVFEANKWKELKSNKRNRPTKRVIDRRFDGPKHLRTRDFGSDDDDEFGFFF